MGDRRVRSCRGRASARRSDSSRSSSGASVVMCPIVCGDGVVPGTFADQAVHLERHAPVRRVALRRRAQFEHVHRLASVELHHVAHAVRHRHRVRAPARGSRRAVRRTAHADRCIASSNTLPTPASSDEIGPRVPVVRGQPLPLDGQHPVALHVAECAVVAQHVEAVEAPLERPARLVTTVLALADVGPHAATRVRRRRDCAPDRGAAASGSVECE